MNQNNLQSFFNFVRILILILKILGKKVAQFRTH